MKEFQTHLADEIIKLIKNPATYRPGSLCALANDYDRADEIISNLERRVFGANPFGTLWRRSL